jgi:hypothetical protein
MFFKKMVYPLVNPYRLFGGLRGIDGATDIDEEINI